MVIVIDFIVMMVKGMIGVIVSYSSHNYSLG